MTLTDIISLITRNHQFILNAQGQIVECGKGYQGSRLLLKDYYRILFDHFALQRTAFFNQLVFLSPDDQVKKEIIFLEENAKTLKVLLLNFLEQYPADWGVKKAPGFKVDFLRFAQTMRERVRFEDKILLGFLKGLSANVSQSTYTLNVKQE